MISGQIIDAIIFLYLGYSAIIGFNRGLFNVLIGVFGIYGASFFAWLFQDNARTIAFDYLGLSNQINVSVIFILFWILLYGVIIVLAKLLTGMFKLTGMSFLIRLSGSLFNTIKGSLILTVILTFISTVNNSLLPPTKPSQFLTSIGTRVLNVYNKNSDENQPIKKESPKIVIDSVIIDDDFRYNLLER